MAPFALLQDILPPAAGGDEAGRIPTDLTYIGLLFALVVVPKALQRYRIPGAITSLVLGVVAGFAGMFGPTNALQLMSTFGITALFLFAGLEIEGRELRRNSRVLVQHGVVWLALLALSAYGAGRLLHLDWRSATLVGLALVTPSTGFILSSLDGFGLDQGERQTIKAKAIGSELLALLLLFIVLQSTSVAQMAVAVAAMIGILVFIPLAFRIFATIVAPYAPRSEFAFLLMVAVVCASATQRLGVYYLVGAFCVGIAAQRFRITMPAMSSEKMVDALEAFGSVFIPFYFFRAGLHVDKSLLSGSAFLCALVLLVVFVPLRIATTVTHRKVFLREPRAKAERVAIALVPTLVFTLVLSDILLTRFGAPEYLVGGLILYTVINTTLPAFLLRAAPPEFDRVHASDVIVHQADVRT